MTLFNDAEKVYSRAFGFADQSAGKRPLAVMDSRSRTAFAWLIAAQAAHSLEEYIFRLFDVFAPARLVSSLFSDNLAAGFAVANVSIILFGVWCYAARVRKNHPGARGYAWFWTGLELANGLGHFALAALRGAYFPGAATAPLLVALSAYLGLRLVRYSPAPPRASTPIS